MKLKTLTCLLLTLLAALPLRAQFNLSGDEPSYLRWYSIETPRYQIIFPEGADSLARRYGTLLEQFRHATGRSLGQIPGQGFRKKMPVVLHTRYVYSNGSVSWAPSRMDLYTRPEAYGSDPSPWEIQLAAHEPRHQAQLQWSESGFMRPLTWLFGEAWSPVGWQLYLDRPYGEGDAVATETGLWKGHRAWTADFLDYYRFAFEQGDLRSWNRWRFGSFKHYTPDVYALGYLTIAGGRYFYDAPLLVQDALRASLKKPWLLAPWNLQREISLRAGYKSFAKGTFPEMQQAYRELWAEEAQARGPFMPTEQFSKTEAFPTEFSSPVVLNGALYVYRNGYAHNNELLRWDGKEFKAVHPMAGHVSQLYPEPERGRLYWSETVTDKRWSLSGTSRIRYMNPSDGKMHDLTREGRLYNPQPSPDGSRLAALDYPINGGTALVVLSAEDGRILARYPAPDGIQLFEAAWLQDQFYALAVAEGGIGLYHLEEGGAWTEVLAPSAQKINNLNSDEEEGTLQWSSDRDGSNQLYTYYPAEGRLVQETSARYGATDFCYWGDSLYYVSQTLKGIQLFRTALADLQPKEVSFADVYEGPVERTLMEQEKAMGPLPDLTEAVPMSLPKPYSKLGHALRFHSWVPLYVNDDQIRSGSFDLSYETAALGATAFFQNTLGSLSGSLGYSLHKDPDISDHWRNALHLRLLYSGLYPVIEANFDLGDQAAYQYTLLRMGNHQHYQLRSSSTPREAPLAVGSIKAYVPLTFNKGGVLRGVIPQVSYSLSNHLYHTGAALFEAPDYFTGLPATYMLMGFASGRNHLLQSFAASIRGYSMLPRAESETYPRWGLGLEAGLSFWPGLENVFTPAIYGYAYGYLPGLWRPQGQRLTATVQKQLRPQVLMIGERRVSTTPRGFGSTAAFNAAQAFPLQWKVTADYAIPVYVGDLSLMPAAYIKNFLLVPHADFTGLGGIQNNLWSAGMDVTAELAGLFFLSYDCSMGVSFSYLGGSWYEATEQEKPYYVGLIFSMDL